MSTTMIVPSGPKVRPSSASALRSALLDLSGLGRWGEEEARAWWAHWRERQAGRTAASTESGTGTVSIDVEPVNRRSC